MTFIQKIFLPLDSKNKTLDYKNATYETVFQGKGDWRQNSQKKNYALYFSKVDFF